MPESKKAILFCHPSLMDRRGFNDIVFDGALFLPPTSSALLVVGLMMMARRLCTLSRCTQ